MKLYKFYSASSKYTLVNILNNQLYFAKPSEFNDPLDSYLKIIENETNKVVFDLRQNSLRVLCLTAEISEYMWKRYADNGNGFCLEYDSEDICKNPEDIKKVVYMPETEIYNTLKAGVRKYELSECRDKSTGLCLILIAYMYKRTKYKEEKEYRALSKCKTKNVVPKRIIIGDKVKNPVKKEIKQHCSMNNIECVLEKSK